MAVHYVEYCGILWATRRTEICVLGLRSGAVCTGIHVEVLHCVEVCRGRLWSIERALRAFVTLMVKTEAFFFCIFYLLRVSQCGVCSEL